MRQPFALRVLAGALAGWVALSSPVWAHHSYAMFDRSQIVTIRGTIKEFQWTYPHVFIWLYVPNQRGGEELWAVEGGAPNMLARRGWNKRVMNPGDKVTLEINPLTDGRTGGYFAKLTRADGKIYTEQGGG